MSISSATKSLDENIETSYETRIVGVSDIAKETRQTLENFKREREEMASTLRSELLSSEQTRRQEFSALIENIKDEVATIENDTTRMLTDFRRDHREMANTLRSKLSSSERDRRQEAGTFQRNLHEQVANTLAEVTADHQQAHAHWEKLGKTKASSKAKAPRRAKN